MAQLTTFVFTDLVGSVALKQRMPGVDAASRDVAYVERVLQPHRERIEAGLAAADGRVVSTAGDGHFLVFPDTARATLWAIEVMRLHRETPIAATEGGPPAEVRIGMHAGAPQPDPADPDNFVGRAVDYAARLADHAQGSQILVSRTTASLIEDGVLDGVWLHSHGPHELRGIGAAELYEILYPGRRPAPPRRNPSDAAQREWSVLPRTMGLTEYVAQSDGGETQRASGVSGTAVRPRRVGNYELQELLGAGGMGNVYKARHAQFDRPRAVKIIRPDLVEAGGEAVVRRFYQEIRATGALEHPNLVVAIDSSNPDDEEHYLVMEYVDGLGVDALLEAEGPLPVADACEIARQAALGLAHLEEQGLVHRDVKPSNLMVTLASNPHLPAGGADSGSFRSASAAKLPVVKLLDLGLALLVGGDEERLTRFDRGGMGTGYYMPPEQWRTTSVDIRADIYSLGCTLYCLLMGEPPYAQSDLKPERAHSTAPIPPLRPACGAPRELTALVQRMLAKDPAERPQSPLEVADALAPMAVGNRLAERVTRLRLGGALARLARDETRPNRASLETDAPTGRSGRSLLSSAALGTPARRFGWLLVAAVTAAACAAVVAVWWWKLGADPSQVAERLESVAGLTARDLATAIDRRIHRLEAAAEDALLQQWLAPRPPSDSDVDAPELGDRNHPLQKWIIDQRSNGDAMLGFRSSSWFVTDDKGVQVARAPYSPTSMGHDYASRDYFHGQGHNLPDDVDTADPLRSPHRSAVYESTSAQGELKVAFSVPIYGVVRAGGRPPVLGVLAMSISLGDFAEFSELEAAGGSEILLADTGADYLQTDLYKGLVLHHRELSSYSRAGAPLRLSDELLAAIARRRSSTKGTLLGEYPDILGRPGLRYLGAVAAVAPKTLGVDPRGPWVVIVQTPVR
ncbi:Serine/threonine-protein kinase PknB [Botrimarina colliarenosi]|uniref:Serine/threonine-protein kinase PknB n=1 Tax=Botrimarina colliarenosi TaxID=2528001 RepID=A0A5C6ABD8_9BACT|nr:protein kinase [Botrimarina colliarenosi]TWT96899.1 Serine/threonine-protein kinase PknB [Botrimarina colliarenosi]